MNFRKTIILSFILVFTLSNVGLPFYLHTCQMKKTESMSACSNCKGQQKELQSFCPDEGNTNSKIIITAKCCENKIAAEPLRDNYFSVSANKIVVTSSEEFVTILSRYILMVEQSSILLSFDLSPPTNSSNNLFIINSVLLI